MCYGIRYEKYDIESYKNYSKLKGAEITVEPCGQFVDSSEPWLVTISDGIIIKRFQNSAFCKACFKK